ncbi:MAG: hypothetical protein Q9M91_04495 [Candidatus Dojkabacteria bacterium]|nr:hypothetical protein [Candidatus Dojkabacteria bacterium]MDQ7021071.1 hypothetical protein [Candidatus Dojkabacteria bacterium]
MNFTKISDYLNNSRTGGSSYRFETNQDKDKVSETILAYRIHFVGIKVREVNDIDDKLENSSKLRNEATLGLFKYVSDCEKQYKEEGIWGASEFKSETADLLRDNNIIPLEELES